jgi:hypothetical protein
VRCAYALAVDDPVIAAAVLRPAVIIAREHLSGFHQAPPLLSAAKISMTQGDDTSSALLLGAFRHFRQGSSFMQSTTGEYEAQTSRLTDRLGSAAAGAEIARGAALTIAQALQLAEDVISGRTEAANPGGP